jgi:sugar phosphate isomerase/epimerase
MKSAITLSLVDEARGGPFVFWGDAKLAISQVHQLGFDAIEIFPPDADTLRHLFLAKSLADHGLAVAAVGTGAGWVKHRLHLADEDQIVRQRAVHFIKTIIDCAAELDAPAIIGSMQGRSSQAVKKETANAYLREGLEVLGQHASQYKRALLFEPLNRYETDQANTLEQALSLINGIPNVQLLADLFHMNIEEQCIADSIRGAGKSIGHVHFADSNRMAIGLGHLDIAPIIQSLRDIGYEGYLSAEVFSKPDPLEAAKQSIESFRKATKP